MNKIVVLAIAAAFAGGCADNGIVDNAAPPAAGPNASVYASPGAPGLTVMTWNVYYGTDPTPILSAAPQDIPFVAAPVWALAQQTNFPARAGVLARAIAAQRPDLVGVQEAALYRIQSPGDLVLNGTTPATQVVYDFLELLVDSLAARGLDYTVVSADSTTDIEVPVFNPGNGASLPFDDVRLTDRDAVLARAGLTTADPQHARFVAHVPLTLGGVESGVYEGWASIDATVGDRTYRFISAHLEAQDFKAISEAQAGELRDLLASEQQPTILVGDFNSDVSNNPDQSRKTDSYRILTEEAGFTDAWLRNGGSPPGLTCCQNDSVSNELPLFNQRVDFIFTRNMPTSVPAGSLGVARSVVGDQRGDRTPSGLWPSDHGGIVATFLTPPVGPRWNTW
jgi:endonuclease/exonuclease/phosphatase family protein